MVIIICLNRRTRNCSGARWKRMRVRKRRASTWQDRGIRVPSPRGREGSGKERPRACRVWTRSLRLHQRRSSSPTRSEISQQNRTISTGTCTSLRKNRTLNRSYNSGNLHQLCIPSTIRTLNSTTSKSAICRSPSLLWSTPRIQREETCGFGRRLRR